MHSSRSVSRRTRTLRMREVAVRKRAPSGVDDAASDDDCMTEGPPAASVAYDAASDGDSMTEGHGPPTASVAHNAASDDDCMTEGEDDDTATTVPLCMSGGQHKLEEYS